MIKIINVQVVLAVPAQLPIQSIQVASSDLEQNSDQSNQCSGGASCTSTASNLINTGSSSDVEQSIDQTNQCSGGASCTSTASNSINSLQINE